MDPETGEDVYDEDDLYYYYESSLEDFVEATKGMEIPDGISDGVKVEDLDTSVVIWVDGRISAEVDCFSQRAVICDFENIEDKHLYVLINLARKEVLAPRFPRRWQRKN